jgi:hypothetical protein
MRQLILQVISIAVLAFVGLTSAASARDYKYCLQGRDYGYPGLCHFTSYHQCQASASGTHSHCGINPHFASRPHQ